MLYDREISRMQMDNIVRYLLDISQKRLETKKREQPTHISTSRFLLNFIIRFLF